MHAKILSSPPSSFRTNVPLASSGIDPSVSGSNSTSKGQSMSTGSSSTGPRPLHLALGSVVSPSPTLTSPPTSSQGSQLPDEGNEAQILTSKRDSISIQSPSSSPGPLSPTVASLRKDSKSRKRSSISYIASTPHSPSYLQTNRHNDLDSVNTAPSPSPLSSSHTRFLADGKGSGLVRTSSLGRKGQKTPRSATFSERASTGSMLANSDSNVANAMEHLKERPPLTLNEKHADLLHFIAQKESKCLELRSQLAVHEAELLQLKRKWEKIVNRGFEKALSPNIPSSSSLSSTSSTASSFPPESASSNNSAGYFPTLNAANTNAPATVVLEGIKESVQGMSRLIVAGLGSIAQVNAAPESTPQTNANVPLPLRLGSAQRRANDSGHGQTESQSSSSTTMSAASNTTSSSFLSTSTTSYATSATSASSSSSMTDNTTKRSTTSGAETESEFGEFADGHTRQRSATLTEHLIVEDTGATPMMSPNPRFQRRKLRVDDASPASVSFSSSANVGGNGGLLLSDSQQEADNSSKGDFDWDEGWDEPASDAQMNDLFLNSNMTTPKKRQSSTPASSSYSPISPMDARQSRAQESEAAGNSRSPSQDAQQMNSWAGSVGKKWGEIKGSSAFAKNQKRASVLLSDIQQTFVASLISPTSSSDPKSVYPTPTTPSSFSTLSSNASHARRPATPPPRTFTTSNNTSSVLSQQSTRRSLIDDSDDESFGESAEDSSKTNTTLQMPLAPRMMSSSVMVPDSAPQAAKAKQSAKTKVEDDDEWNW